MAQYDEINRTDQQPSARFEQQHKPTVRSNQWDYSTIEWTISAKAREDKSFYLKVTSKNRINYRGKYQRSTSETGNDLGAFKATQGNYDRVETFENCSCIVLKRLVRPVGHFLTNGEELNLLLLMWLLEKAFLTNCQKNAYFENRFPSDEK